MTSLSNNSRVRPQFIICLLLTVGTLLLYYPVGQFEFINYDDPGYVTQNRWVQSGLSWQNILMAFKTFEHANWHPLTWLSHMMDVTLYGMNSGAHHLTNVQFHILNTLLLFLLLLRLTNEIWKSALVAALFAIHPLHIESVAWVSERKDVLSAFFFMLTLRCYVAYVEQPNLTRYLLVMAMFVLGLMAKPMLVTLPFLLLLLDYWPLKRLHHNEKKVYRTSKQGCICSSSYFIGYLILEKAPLIILSVVSSIVTFTVQQNARAVSSLDTLPIIVRISNSLISYVTYIGKLIIPINMSVFYPYPSELALWKTGLSLLILLSFSLFVIRNIAIKPYLMTGWFWFVGMLVPVIGIVQVGYQSMADRYVYIPAIGIYILVVWVGWDIIKYKNSNQIIFKIIPTVIVFIYAFISVVQLSNWKNSYLLFEHALQSTKNNAIAHINIGSYFASKLQFEQAYFHYEQALKLGYNSSVAHFNMAAHFDLHSDKIKSEFHYREAIRLEPELSKAYINLSQLLYEQGRQKEALNLLESANRIDPNNPQILANIAAAYINGSDPKKGLYFLYKSLEIEPNNAFVHFDLGCLLDKIGRSHEAVHHLSISLQLKPKDTDIFDAYRKALRNQNHQKMIIESFKDQLKNDPQNINILYELALIYKKNQNLTIASKYLKRVLEISPHVIRALENLAIIHAVKGEYDQALELLNRMTIADPDNPMGYYYAAGIYARKNQVESAIEWLKKAVDKGFSDMTLLKNDSNMKNIRETAYYQELVAGSDKL